MLFISLKPLAPCEPFLLSRTSYATGERCIRSSQIGNDLPRFDLHAFSGPSLLVLYQVHFLRSSFARPSFLFSRFACAQDHSHVSCAIFLSANRYRSRSRSCRNITLKLHYSFDPASLRLSISIRSPLVGGSTRLKPRCIFMARFS